MAKRFCKRPWGWWLVLADHKHFKVKLFRVKKGRSISLQKHSMRGEVWMLLSGYGKARLHWSPRYFRINAGDYFRVSRGYWHQYTAYKSTLVLEVQYGEKCIEEDIVRA